MYKPVKIGGGGGAALGLGVGAGGSHGGLSGALAYTGLDLLPWVLLALAAVVGGAVLLRMSMLRRRSGR